MGGQFGAGGIDPPDDLGRPIGQQLSGLGEPDASPDPLQSCAPVSASSRARWWLTEGCE
ncbi:MAG TPA: hypothetical protein VNO51_25225 [Ilumatobacteraceae bacterium]|nr:hypothetical protein [Ilumatobacteraceae bacterium]